MAIEALTKLRLLAVCDWFSEHSTIIVDEKQVETAIECMLTAFERKENTVDSVKTFTTTIKDEVTLLENMRTFTPTMNCLSSGITTWRWC